MSARLSAVGAHGARAHDCQPSFLEARHLASHIELFGSVGYLAEEWRKVSGGKEFEVAVHSGMILPPCWISNSSGRTKISSPRGRRRNTSTLISINSLPSTTSGASCSWE